MLPRPLASLLFLALSLLPTVADALEPVVVRAGELDVVLYDRPGAERAEDTARWLAEGLAPLLVDAGPQRLEVERRGMEQLYRIDGGRLVLHPRLPSASVDEQLQVYAMALWLLQRDDAWDHDALLRAVATLEPLRPTSWAPKWWPRCCRGLDALAATPVRSAGPAPTLVASEALEEVPPTASSSSTLERFALPVTKAHGRADLYGGFPMPLLDTWPWVIGTFALYAPLEHSEIVLGLEAMPLGLVEARAGFGYAHRRRWLLRINGGPLVAWNPGAWMPSHQQPDIDYTGTRDTGVWVDGELGGFRGLVRVIPDWQPGVDAWFGWERRLQVSPRWYLLPFGRARYVSDTLPQRVLSMGGPTGVRWMDMDVYLTHRTATVRMEAEHVIPTGRLPGPAWLRPRAVLLRAGADCGYAPEHQFVGGWSAAMGLALHPVREVKGVGWLTVAAPTDLSSFTWIVWLSTWLPQP
jgi:hypothetical protein